MFLELFDAFSPKDHLSPGSSALVAFVLVPVPLLWVAHVMGRRVREIERAIARYTRPPAGHRLLSGVVRTPDGEPAITVRRQERMLSRPTPTRTTGVWQQTATDFTSQRFRIDFAGEVLPVEPGAAPYLDDGILTIGPTQVDGDRRVRTLVLPNQAVVCAFGRFEPREAAPSHDASYREAQEEKALRPPDDGPLEFHSGSPVGTLRTMLDRSRRCRWQSVALLVSLELLAFPGYLAQVSFGQRVGGTVSSVSERSAMRVGRYGGSPVALVCATANDSRERVCSRVARDDVGRFREGQPVSVLLVAAVESADQLGEHGSLHAIAAIVALALTFCWPLGAPWRRPTPWRSERAR